MKDVILVVDDAPEMLELYVEMLSPHYQIMTAVDGQDGLVKALDYLPVLIISDVRMPVLDGHGFVAALKMNSETRGIPVIFVSTYDSEEIRLSGFRGDVEDYILKPFGIPEFIARIDALVIKSKKRLKAANRSVEIEQQLDYVRQFQYNLLPGKLPDVAGYAVAAELNFLDKVGGDFYEVRLDQNGVLHLIIADVSGHGIMPAFLVAIVSVTFRNYYEKSEDCTALMTELDRTVFEYGIQGFFVTAFYVRLDTRTGILQYANAGHPRLLLLRHGANDVEMLDTDGLPLGPFFDSGNSQRSKFQQDSVQLNYGDRLMLYTDGITEAANKDGQMYSEEKLSKYFCDSRHKSPEAAIADLFGEINQFIDRADQHDDMTVLILSRNAQ